MVEAKLLRKKLKNGLIVDKWDLVTIIEKQEAQIAELETGLKNVWKVVEGKQTEIEALQKQLYFKDYYEELPDTPVDLLRKAQGD